jgi:hypothetical protein
MRHLKSLIFDCLSFTGDLITCLFTTDREAPAREGLLPLYYWHTLLLCEEVSRTKTINIKQYLSTNNFSVNNRHFVIQSSQITQRYITKVFHKKNPVVMIT